ncbi:MAG: class I SAM-dependent methyltransferase [Lentisphaerae bacterium]|nr:class I SAM-dependent methyltransferase [Lentisphaerota bacterium]
MNSGPSSWIVEPAEQGVVFIHKTTAKDPQPDDWRQRLTASLRGISSTLAVGAKRLADPSTLYSMGEFIIHPKGFHSLGKGVPVELYRFPEEVDAVGGGYMAVDDRAFLAVGGPALLQGELGALQLGLALRSMGGRCVIVPDVTVVDTSFPQPTAQEHQAFVSRWGFDWRAPDMEEVARLHRGTGLLWNVRFQARPMPFTKYRQRGALHWTSYDQVPVYRQRADEIVHVFTQACPTGRVLDVGCGDGLFSHLLATRGLSVTGLDAETEAIAHARRMTASRPYPGAPPQFLTGSGEHLPFDAGSFESVTLIDVIEHLLNPVRILRETNRVLKPGGYLLVVTPAWKFGALADYFHVCEYSPEELFFQVQAVCGFPPVLTGQIEGPYRDLVAVFRKPA